MNEIERESATYQPLSTACLSIFFILDSLHYINRLYQFSLNFFDIFNSAIADGPAEATDKAERLDKIVKFLVMATYLRASRSLLHQNRICLGLLLAKIEFLLYQNNIALPELNHVLQNQDILVKPNEIAACGFDDSFTEQQKENCIRHQRRVKHFGNLDSAISSNLAAIKSWMNNKSTELPSLYDSSNDSPVWQAAHLLLL
ncbi:Oidioi.mRNA.OKI2018_I69.XSR.g13524.t1.cds [Oikopleura dioica]|uniref:Oidioi.mRNA.OKI2018_I69.XSR.g13524.t1.cds n=1 Tax=Oikopleura dioica TaxID=34765 RepID=A0ABN7SBU2_OIKDI|nr:Oidioi.mRNA.OKI2018_I69.XSR.g13524.t1.cds [Oikopleura dioica]